MEAQYHQFGPVSVSTGHSTVTLPKVPKNIVIYILFAILFLLLFTLLLITGVKFSHLSADVNYIKIQVEHANSKPFSEAHSEAQAERVQQVFLTKIIPVRGKCQEGWVSFEKSCYLLSTTAEPWNRAETQCQNHQGHLLVVNKVEELDFISKIVELTESYWIGLVERQEEGHWSWVDGTNYNSTQTFWDRGQPDDWDYRENGEDCGQLHGTVKRKRKLWNDADCSLSYRYICESSI